MSRPVTPQNWLRVAHLRDAYRHNDFDGLSVGLPPPDLVEHEALALIYQCAIAHLCSPLALERLCETFDEALAPKTIKETLCPADGTQRVVIYVTSWKHNATDAFHIPPGSRPPCVEVGNLFLRQEDIQKLPNTEKSLWTAADKRFLFFLTWTTVHELSHAVGSLLFEQGSIPNHVTPLRATAFSSPGCPHPDYVVGGVGPAGQKAMHGERGWYMEDRLGGHVKIEESSWDNLYVERPDANEVYKVDDDQVERFLNRDVSVLPLELRGSPKLLTAYQKAHLKGHQLSDLTFPDHSQIKY